MGAIPDWMWQVGAMLKGADMAMDIGNNAVNLYDNIGGIVDRSRFKDDLEKVQADPYAQVRAYASNQKVKRDKDGGITTSGSDYNNQLDAARQLAYTRDAAPLQQFLSGRVAKGNIAEPGWTAQDTVDTEYTGPTPDSRNPVANTALADFTRRGNLEQNMRSGNIPALYNADPALADKFTEGQVRMQATIPKSQADVRKIDEEIGGNRANIEASNWYASKMSDPEFTKLTPEQKAASLMASFKVNADNAGKILDTTNTYRKTRNVEGGYGPGQDMQYTVDERTGQTIGTVGTPQDQQRKATRVSVNPVIQQESAYSKGKGEYLAKREGDIMAAGDTADAQAPKLVELEKALAATPAGPLANVLTTVGKYTDGRLGANKKEVANAATVDTINKLNTLSNIKQLGPGITNDERKFLMDAQTKRTLTRQEQAKVLGIYKKDNEYKRTIRDNIVRGTFGPEARQADDRSERGVTQPPTAAEIRAELQRRKAEKGR